MTAITEAGFIDRMFAQLAAGQTIPEMIRADEAEARAQIAASRTTLEHLLQAPVTLFAYPNGRPNTDYDARTVAIAESLGLQATGSGPHMRRASE